MTLLFLALAPVVAIATFIYLRDKYEREPLKHLVISFLLGVLCAIPAVLMSISLEATQSMLYPVGDFKI